MKGNIIIVIAGFLFFIGCKKDNKEPPSSTINGRILYQGQPLSVRSGGVELELWQYGYQLRNKIPVYVKQDGSFSARVFNGSYKMTLLKGNGPWADKPDSIDVQVNGTVTADVSVDPYFIVNDVTYQRAGNDITATFRIQPVNTSRTLEAARLYFGQTTILDQNFNLGNAGKPASQIPDFGQPVTITGTIPAALQSKDHFFVRVGVKTNGVAELLYSPPMEMSGK